jgi:hypothetical protein
MTASKIKVGDIFHTKKGYEIVVTKRISARFVEVEFQAPIKHKAIISTSNIRSGAIKNVFAPSVEGMGYIGFSKVLATSKCYTSWRSILKRVSKNATAKDKVNYSDCSICREWLCLEAYSEWYNKQIVQNDWALDKDLLVKGNKVYSPDTCIFLPTEVNAFLTDRANHRGRTPLGVHRGRNKKFEVQCTSGGKNNYLGVYDTPEDAFEAYKKFKISRAILLADKWCGIIDQKAILALRAFNVDIKD